jgi:hypothetical protein
LHVTCFESIGIDIKDHLELPTREVFTLGPYGLQGSRIEFPGTFHQTVHDWYEAIENPARSLSDVLLEARVAATSSAA